MRRAVIIENKGRPSQGSTACFALLSVYDALFRNFIFNEAFSRPNLLTVLDGEVDRLTGLLSFGPLAGQQATYCKLLETSVRLIERDPSRRVTLFALFLRSLAKERLRSTPSAQDVFIVLDILVCMLGADCLHSIGGRLEHVFQEHNPTVKRMISEKHESIMQHASRLASAPHISGA